MFHNSSSCVLRHIARLAHTMQLAKVLVPPIALWCHTKRSHGRVPFLAKMSSPALASQRLLSTLTSVVVASYQSCDGCFSLLADIYGIWVLPKRLFLERTFGGEILLHVCHKCIFHLLCGAMRLFLHSLWAGGDPYAAEETKLRLRVQQVGPRTQSTLF